MTKVIHTKTIKKSKRVCGNCGEEDTILFCCECMRKIIEDKTKQILKEIQEELKKELGVFHMGALYEGESIWKIMDEKIDKILKAKMEKNK